MNISMLKSLKKSNRERYYSKNQYTYSIFDTYQSSDSKAVAELNGELMR